MPRKAHARRALMSLACAVGVAAATLSGAALDTTNAAGGNPVTPGTFTGKGFDQCEAPSSYAMDRWRAASPYRAVGIYISGYSRACRTQANLTPTWVSHQLANGWHLMPITLGPQASCSTRFPRYGWSIDPTINPDPADSYGKARAQGRAAAANAVDTAGRLGIVPRSTLFYDLEGFDASRTACRESAKFFTSAWTNELHRRGYASGFYSSAASGIKMLDQARIAKQPGITLPDQIWIADWNNRADVYSSYISNTGWMPHARAHQYRGGHNETWGGVTINIDTNWVDLTTPTLPGGTSTPSPTSGPAPTTGTADPKCYPASINRPIYTATSATTGAANVTALQCLLKQQGLYGYEVTGTWNVRTLPAVQGWQRKVGHPVTSTMSRSDFTSILVAGNTGRILQVGSTGADVTRVQRAMNAVFDRRLSVTGSFDIPTRDAVRAYKTKFGLNQNGVVGEKVWALLAAGRR